MTSHFRRSSKSKYLPYTPFRLNSTSQSRASVNAEVLLWQSRVRMIVALVAGSILWLTLRIRGRLSASLLLAQGALFAGYVGYVISRL